MRDASAYRLGVLVTHPVQYFAPLFREVARDPRVDLTVFYAHLPTPQEQGAGFGVPFTWDVDLMSGYRHVLLENRARAKGDGFLGYDTPEIADIVQRERFDAFVVSGWHALTYWQAMRACWSSDTPLLVRGDSQLGVRKRASVRWAKNAVYPLFMRRFAACMAVGTRSAEYFRHYGARRVALVPHFVDNEQFATTAAACTSSAIELRTRLGIPPDAIVALFAGKLIDVKSPLDAVRAVARCGDDRVHLMVVGDGPLRDACERESAAARGRVHFAGFFNQTQMPVAYAAADLLVLPSHQETWGLVVNEAMACGLPVLVSDAVGCAPDLVVEGVTGRTFAPGDVSGLARLLDEWTRDISHMRTMGAAARAHVASWSASAAANAFVSTSIDAVRSGRRRAA